MDSDFSALVPAIVENEGYALVGSSRAVSPFPADQRSPAPIDNLTDSDHMEPLGYPVLGRTARLGLKVGF